MNPLDSALIKEPLGSLQNRALVSLHVNLQHQCTSLQGKAIQTPSRERHDRTGDLKGGCVTFNSEDERPGAADEAKNLGFVGKGNRMNLRMCAAQCCGEPSRCVGICLECVDRD